VRNRREKKELVERGCAHGILVYAKGEPVGWCQYGPREELPRIDNSRKYRGLGPEGSTSERLWRITCFAVLKEYRKRGVATTGLKAALEAIRKKGGGLVEAYPITRWESYAFGNESTHGTATMFEREGFVVQIRSGYYTFSQHPLTQLSRYVLNSLICLFERKGMILAPSYLVYALGCPACTSE